MSLRPQHKCPKCQEIVHPLCGFLTGDSEYTCPSCHKTIEQMTILPVLNKVSASDSTCEVGSTKNMSENEICVNTDIGMTIYEESSSTMSTITENKDKSKYTSITKDYFVTGAQHINMIAKDRDGDIWVELRRAVSERIDEDLKAMMILRSQEVGLKIVTDDDEKTVSSWNDIGKAWQNSDSIDTAKKYTKMCMKHLMTTHRTKFTWRDRLWNNLN